MIDPRQEREHTFTFEVTLHGYGHRDRVLLDTATALAAALHRIDRSDRWVLRVDGRRVRYDALAADGEHGSALTIEPDPDAADTAADGLRRSGGTWDANGSGLG